MSAARYDTIRPWTVSVAFVDPPPFHFHLSPFRSQKRKGFGLQKLILYYAFPHAQDLEHFHNLVAGRN